MKFQITEKVEIPEGISCSYENKVLKCVKGSLEISRIVNLPKAEVKVDEKFIVLSCKKSTKKERKTIMSFLAHIKNIFAGLDKKFVYKLQAVNVHFPITLKVEGENLLINNFLGEKNPRTAKILSDVNVEVKGQEITISSKNKEAAGQTATNFEKATKIKRRDRRVFQDGIYIVEKPSRLKGVENE